MKKTFKFYLALFISKLISKLIKVFFKNRGTHLPGVIAIKICDNFLSLVEVPKTIIAVTGTNGKTSTSNLIKEVLVKNNITVLNNSLGSNMAPGIVSSIIEKCNMKGKVNEDVAVFEVDERGSFQVYKYIKPTYLICTNLFRDSIKRNGHSEFIFKMLDNNIPKSTKLILNGDDLISNRLCLKNDRVYFSLDKIKRGIKNNIVRDINVCPLCKSKLTFDYIHYHHIGYAHCTKCSFKSPKGDFIGVDLNFKTNKFFIKEKNKKYEYNMISDSIYNLYNLIGTVAVLRTYGLSHKQISNGLKDLKLKETRYDSIKTNNIEVLSMLSKNQNPISTSLTIDYISNLKGNKSIVLLVTDTKDKQHGSEDISWLYDTDFEFLNKNDIKQIIVCGNRCYDLSARLKIAGIDESIILTQEDYNNIDKLIKMDDVEKVIILYELYGYDIASQLKRKVAGV